MRAPYLDGPRFPPPWRDGPASHGAHSSFYRANYPCFSMQGCCVLHSMSQFCDNVANLRLASLILCRYIYKPFTPTEYLLLKSWTNPIGIEHL